MTTFLTEIGDERFRSHRQSPISNLSSLLALKVGLALLDVGGQSFFGILALEELLLQLALQRQRGLERNLGTGLDRARDQADRFAGLVGRQEAAREVTHPAHEGC